MRFSEEVMLGRNLIKFTPDTYLSEGCGCLIGMAGAARGETSFCHGKSYRIVKLWPWMFGRMVECPCDCSCSRGDVIQIINHLAHHVSSGSWTIERFCDWVRSVEPAEAEQETLKGETDEQATNSRLYAASLQR